MQKMKRTLSVLLMAAAVPWLAAAAETASTNGPAAAKAASAGASLFPDAVVAKAKGFEIKRSQLDAEALPQAAQYAAAGRPLPPNKA